MKTERLLVFIILCTVVLLSLPGDRPAKAHPADMYLHSHTLTLAPEGITLRWSLIPGTLLGAALYRNADGDGDGVISQTEAEIWLTPNLPELQAAVDGRRVDWTVTAIAWPRASVDLELGRDAVHIDLEAPWPGAGFDDARLIGLRNDFEPGISTSWFVVQTSGALAFNQPTQDGANLQFELADDATWTYWDSGMPVFPDGIAPQEVIPSAAPTANSANARAELTRIVTEGARSPVFYLGALLTAAVLGILHALTPGHGKALVGAYLVGARGTPRHAVILGAIVTVTHTGSVLGFGLIILAASRFVMPNTLFPVLELASGLLILGLGALLLRNRMRGLRGYLQRQAANLQPAQTVVGGAMQAARAPSPPTSGKTRIAVHQPVAVGGYGEVFTPPVANAAPGVSWRSLVALGVSGGMVPCPDAIAILLVAVAINRVILGLSLIVTFSLGMAVVLITIGLLIVRGQRFFGGKTGGMLTRYAPAIAVFSAVVVLFLGGYLTVNAVSKTGWLESESDDRAGDLVFAPTGFDADRATVLFLASDAEGRQQLYRQTMADDEAEALTAAQFGIWGYALGPDGSTLIVAQREGDRSSSLLRMDLSGEMTTSLVQCDGAFCSEMVWAPDGGSLLYERLDLETGVNSLLTLDPVTGATAPAFRDPNLPAFAARYAPDGTWLSYISPNTNGIQLYHLGAGTSVTLPNTNGIQLYHLGAGTSVTLPSGNGQPVMWAPDGTALLYVDLPPDGATFTPRLKHYELASATVTDISGDTLNQDMLAAWSPDGSWVALVRAQPDETGTVRGNQLVLVRPDGTESRALTTEPNYIYGEPVWSPDGTALLAHRYPLAVANARPEIIRVDVATGAVVVTVERGHNPMWVS